MQEGNKNDIFNSIAVEKWIGNFRRSSAINAQFIYNVPYMNGVYLGAIKIILVFCKKQNDLKCSANGKLTWNAEPPADYNINTFLSIK